MRKMKGIDKTDNKNKKIQEMDKKGQNNTLNEEELNISINTENYFLRVELENIKKQLEVAVANNEMLLQRQQQLQQPQPPSIPPPAQPQIPAPQQPATLQMIPPQLASSQEKSDEQILTKQKPVRWQRAGRGNNRRRGNNRTYRRHPHGRKGSNIIIHM
ncbi:uncharacterized protein LOC115241998 [Formica exsecta]|uniref:uncharacterized protein LOC115241998 n=1 Tax=Formica exsecta TaxID=72781 RepID=UPI001143EF39|nr:uncharacterized protein LOC115241998 [Formica exsecta]